MDLLKREIELKKRLKYPYKWGRKQNNLMDYNTNFIYEIYNFDDLLLEIKKKFEENEDYDDYFNYAINRWFNFWSANAIEEIFCKLKGVEPDINKKNKLVDFKINGIKFDHKSSIFPRGFGKNIEYSYNNKSELINWLYLNQSQEQRKHLKNRLFIIFYNKENGEHWKLKAELLWIVEIINKYIKDFDKNKLLKFNFEENNSEETYSDIIWATK